MIEKAASESGMTYTLLCTGPFLDWGIPTARAIRETRAALPDDAFLIGSGGIRHGLDAAKAIRLGANMVGQAAGLLGPALEGTQSVVDFYRTQIKQLRIACFVTGSVDLQALKHAPLQEPELTHERATHF